MLMDHKWILHVQPHLYAQGKTEMVKRLLLPFTENWHCGCMECVISNHTRLQVFRQKNKLNVDHSQHIEKSSLQKIVSSTRTG